MTESERRSANGKKGKGVAKTKSEAFMASIRRNCAVARAKRWAKKEVAHG